MSSIKASGSLWKSAHNELKNLFPEDVFDMWFSDLSCSEETDNKLVLTAKSEFNAIWIENNYLDIIHKQVCGFAGSDVKVTIEVAESDVAEIADSRFDSRQQAKADQIEERTIRRSATMRRSLINPTNTFDNFVVGSGCQLAHAASIAVANAPGRAYNPLFVFGETGLGKTHLMHAVAHQMLVNNPKARIAYVSTEKFTNEFIHAIRENKLTKFRQYYRNVDALLVDDIHFLAGKESTQEEFFHTFNSLVGQSKQIIISGDRAPSDLDGLEERLRSRLSFGLVGEIHKADYELRLSILHTKIEAKKDVVVDDEIIQFLAKKISSNVRELEGALRRLVAHSELVNRPLNLEVAKQLLHDLLKVNERKVSVEDIQKKVAEYFNIRFNDMISVRRSRVVARPRQVAMYLSKNYTPKSLPEIGRKFGGRDHTTVMHAIKKVQELCKIDPSFAEHIKVLKKTLEL